MRNRIIAAIIITLTVLLPISVACSNPQSIALNVVKEWTEDVDNIAAITNEIADLVVENVPGVTGLLSSTIKNQIKEGISWSYFPASEVIGDRLPFAAKATITLDLPLLGEYVISVINYFHVHIAEQIVSAWTLAGGTFDFSKSE